MVCRAEPNQPASSWSSEAFLSPQVLARDVFFFMCCVPRLFRIIKTYRRIRSIRDQTAERAA